MSRSFSKANDQTLPKSRASAPVITPGKELPLLCAVGTALGPVSAAPASYTQADYAILEFNPLYSGFLFDADRTWAPTKRPQQRTTFRMSGAVETTFFGGVVEQGDDDALNFTESVFQEVVMTTVAPFRLADAAYISSYAPAAALYRPGKFVQKGAAMFGAGLRAEAPITIFDQEHGTTNSELFALGDGAASGNVPIINLLQRQVKCVAGFWWQVFGKDITWWQNFVDSDGTANPSAGQIDYDLAAIFGVQITDYDKGPGADGADVTKNQVFERGDLVHLLRAFLELHERKKYLVHRMRLKTINNDYLGVRSYDVEMIFSYASVSEDFIKQVENTKAAKGIVTYADDEYQNNLIFKPAQGFFWQSEGFSWSDHFDRPWAAKYGHSFPNGKTGPMTFSGMEDLDAWMLYQNAGNSILANGDIYEVLRDPTGPCRAGP